MSGSLSVSLGGVAGRSDSETSVDEEEKPGDAMGSLWLRECDECAVGEYCGERSFVVRVRCSGDGVGAEKGSKRGEGEGISGLCTYGDM